MPYLTQLIRRPPLMQPLPMNQPRQNWFFRYKLYHLPFWFLYNYLLWVVTIGNPIRAANALLVFPFAVKYSFYVLFQALAVYVNLYWLMPRFLEKNQFGRYGLYLFLTILVATLFIISGYYCSAYVSGRSLDDLYGGGTEADCFYRFLGNALPATIASMTLAMSIKLTQNWLQTRRRQQLLEKEKLETELTFLKNQFNPHFLFNTINSIFFLIHKNPDMASASLAKFSDLLRYQLYECNDAQISLSKELAYIDNFVGLERLRQNSNVQVTIGGMPVYTDHLGIAPFILMTFVENAFKHVSKQADQPNAIELTIQLQQDVLSFYIANTTTPGSSTEAVAYSGIGLKNVQRRLDLVYPGLYDLQIRSKPDWFVVQLDVQLSPFSNASILQAA